MPYPATSGEVNVVNVVKKKNHHGIMPIVATAFRNQGLRFGIRLQIQVRRDSANSGRPSKGPQMVAYSTDELVKQVHGHVPGISRHRTRWS